MTKGYPLPQDKHVQRAFHGTDFDFDGEVLPHGETGCIHFAGLSGDDVTYFIPAEQGDVVQAEKDAWRWSGSNWSSNTTNRSRRRVHVTMPVGQQWFDNNLHGNGQPYSEDDWFEWARVANRQIVLDTMWCPPPDDRHTFIEPTLPRIDWKEYGGEWWITHGIGEHGPYAAIDKNSAAPGDDDAYYAKKWARPEVDEAPVPQPVPEGQEVLDVGDGGYVPPPPKPEQPIVRFLGGGDYVEPYRFLENYGMGRGVTQGEMTYLKGDCKPFDYGMAKRQTEAFKSRYSTLYPTMQSLDWPDKVYKTFYPSELDGTWGDDIGSDP